MVSPSSGKFIYQNINSTVKELWMVEGAHHPIMNEDEYIEPLFTRTVTFLEKLSQ